MAEVTLEALLAARDDRTQVMQNYFDSGIGSMVIATMNIPGAIKSSTLISRAFDLAMQDLLAELGSEQLLLLRKEVQETGPYALFLIKGATTSAQMKERLIVFEDSHPIGRLLDLDVKLKNGSLISRKNLGYPARRCFLCEQDANLCRKRGTHTVKELSVFTKQHLHSYVKTSSSYHPIDL
jgi:holo-ACP synthase